MNEIRITCKTNDVLALERMEPFQGNLKDLSEKNFEKIKKVILKHGFCEPISIWVHEGHNYILNGHQRFRTLMKMKEDGCIIPELPVNLVKADTVKEAKEKILAFTSQYGNMTGEGLDEFMNEAGFELPEIQELFRFPELKLGMYSTQPQKEKFVITIDCESQDQKNELLEEFKNRELKCK